MTVAVACEGVKEINGVQNLSNVECLLVRQAKSGPSRKLKGVYR